MFLILIIPTLTINFIWFVKKLFIFIKSDKKPDFSIFHFTAFSNAYELQFPICMCASLGNKNNYHMFQFYFQRFSREMDKLKKNKRLLIKVYFEKNIEILNIALPWEPSLTWKFKLLQ